MSTIFWVDETLFSPAIRQYFHRIISHCLDKSCRTRPRLWVYRCSGWHLSLAAYRTEMQVRPRPKLSHTDRRPDESIVLNSGRIMCLSRSLFSNFGIMMSMSWTAYSRLANISLQSRRSHLWKWTGYSWQLSESFKTFFRCHWKLNFLNVS